MSSIQSSLSEANKIEKQVFSQRGNDFGAQCVWGMDMVGIPSTKLNQEVNENIDEPTMRSLLSSSSGDMKYQDQISSEEPNKVDDLSHATSEVSSSSEETSSHTQEQDGEKLNNCTLPNSDESAERVEDLPSSYSKDITRYVDDLIQKDDSGVESSGSNQCINEILSNSPSDDNCKKASDTSHEYLAELVSSEESSESTLVYCCSNSSSSKPSSTEDEQSPTDVANPENGASDEVSRSEKHPGDDTCADNYHETEYLHIELKCREDSSSTIPEVS